MKARSLKRGDTVGVIAQSEPITKDCMEDIEKSVSVMRDLGINVKFSKHAFCNTTGYGETARNKAEDINKMFEDKEIDRNILCHAEDLIVTQCLII